MGGDGGTYEEEGEVEVSEGCPGEEELNGVVDELELVTSVRQRHSVMGGFRRTCSSNIRKMF